MKLQKIDMYTYLIQIFFILNMNRTIDINNVILNMNLQKLTCICINNVILDMNLQKIDINNVIIDMNPQKIVINNVILDMNLQKIDMYVYLKHESTEI